MNSIVNWQDGGCIINIYCEKVIKIAKITMGVHINQKKITVSDKSTGLQINCFIEEESRFSSGPFT